MSEHYGDGSITEKLDRIIELLEELVEIEKHDHDKKDNWAMPT